MYEQRIYTFGKEGGAPVPTTIRSYTADDFDELIDIQAECFPPPFPSELWWNREQLQSHVDLFPAGALCVEMGGKLVGSMTGLIVKTEPSDPDHLAHSWAGTTDNGYIRNHCPEGDTLYIVDISVRPGYRKYGLGKCLMMSMYQVVVYRGLDRLLGGGRMSGYHKHAHELTAEQYLSAVIEGRLNDPVITFLLRCGRTPVGVAAGYLEDEESHNYAAMMEWRNPFRRRL